jgi:hypothetical protein
VGNKFGASYKGDKLNFGKKRPKTWSSGQDIKALPTSRARTLHTNSTIFLNCRFHGAEWPANTSCWHDEQGSTWENHLDHRSLPAVLHSTLHKIINKHHKYDFWPEIQITFRYQSAIEYWPFPARLGLRLFHFCKNSCSSFAEVPRI